MSNATPAMADHSANGGYGHEPQPVPHPGPIEERGQFTGWIGGSR